MCFQYKKKVKMCCFDTSYLLLLQYLFLDSSSKSLLSTLLGETLVTKELGIQLVRKKKINILQFLFNPNNLHPFENGTCE